MLIGSKMVLEEIDPENLEELRLWRNDPALRKYFREYKDITKDRQALWYKEKGNNTNPEHVYFQIMALDEYYQDKQQQIDNRSLIGCCGLHYIDFRARSAEFGIFLGACRGTGRGKEALSLLCKYGFEELNLHKIWAEVYQGNESIHLYHKLGFKDEGILRDSYFHEGKYGDSIMMGLLEDEWKSTQKVDVESLSISEQKALHQKELYDEQRELYANEK